MAPRKFNKANSQTFSLVYRAQNDPRIHDSEAGDMVFTEKPAGNVSRASSKIKNRGDLENEFGFDVRANEGEAANYGIFYDDSGYDYMQHMRELGTGGDAFYIDAAPVKGGRGKGKSLEYALRDLDLGATSDTKSQSGVSVASSTASTASMYFDDDQLPSEFVKKITYQDMQDVPDAIAGFQPGMDPRLREVLEALEDEAYVDDDEEVFSALQKDAKEVEQEEFEADTFDLEAILEEEDGWESDHTIKANEQSPEPRDAHFTNSESLEGGGVPLPDEAGKDGPDHGDGAWLEEFSKFKKDQKSSKETPAQRQLGLQSEVTGASSVMSGRRKKRKGAMTSTSGYSMSSSILARTEGQSILDRKFERLEEEYAAGDDEDEFNDTNSMLSGMSGLSGLSKASGLSNLSVASRTSTTSSQAPKLLRVDFDNIMDDFLNSHQKIGKKTVRRGKPQSGLEQLDEIRKELGRTKAKSKSKS